MPYSSGPGGWGVVIPHPLPEVNYIMVEIPTPKPYIFMIRMNRQIKCPNNLFFVLWNLMISWIVFILHRKMFPIHHTYIYSLVSYLFIKQDQRFWLATRLLHLWCFLNFLRHKFSPFNYSAHCCLNTCILKLSSFITDGSSVGFLSVFVTS